MIADLLCVVAHPDDETFGLGSVLAKTAADGHRVVVVCATRGELGADISGSGLSGDELGKVREQEVREAATILGVAEVLVLDLRDSGWDGPHPAGALVDRIEAATERIAAILESQQPRVVVTLDPTGSDGHRDHAAIGRATTAAVGQRVDSAMALYHWCLPRSLMDRWAIERGGNAGVYGEKPLGRPDGEITTVVQGHDVLDARRRAIAVHRTQASPFTGLSPELEHAFLTTDHLVRILPAWAGGPQEVSLAGL